ncbi:MAG: DUF87 domain-containing protein [Ruminococcus flavefaciens]|nr:DUF87 domain-containing protein [Ruminococcus flavefaciens]
MADSPFVLIKIDNMLYVQQEHQGHNQQQTLMNNSQQNIAVSNYPLTAEQAVKNLQMNGYFADIQKTVDEENFVFSDELVESPQQMYLSLAKSGLKLKNITKTVYLHDRYGNEFIHGSEQTKPVAKNKFESIRFAEFIVSEASIIYVENGYTFDKRIYLKCVSIYGKFNVLITLEDFNKYRIKKYIDSRTKFQAFTNNFKDSEINRLMFNYIKNKLAQSEQEYLLIYKPGFKREENGNWRFISYDKSAFLSSKVISKSHFDIKNFDVGEAGKILNEYCHFIKEYEMEKVALLRLSALLLTPLASLGYKLSKTIVIYGCNSHEKKQALNTWLKVYNRDGSSGSPVYKLSALKQSQIKAIAYDNKDCFVLFDDNSVTVKNKTMPDSEKLKMELIAELFSFGSFSDNPRAECNCAVLSDRYMMQGGLSDEAFLFYDMSNLETYGLDDINRICYDFDKVVVDFVKSFFEKYRNDFEIIDSENVDDFKYNSSKNAYLTLSMCIAVFRKMCSIYECSVFTDEDFQDWSDSVYNIISDSEYFNDEKTIVEEFAYELNYLINEDEIQLADCNVFNADLNNDKKFIYVKDNLLLIRSGLFRDILSDIPVFVVDREGVNLRRIMAERDLIEYNSGANDRYLYRTSITDSGKREYFIAVRTKLLGDDARNKLPVKGAGIYPVLDTSDSIERIKIGISENGEPVYWSIGADLMNRHLFVRGKSGSGKTYFLTSLAKKLNDMGKCVVILDCAEFSGYDRIELMKVLSEDYVDKNITISNNPMTVDEVIQNENKITVIRSSAGEAEKFLSDMMKYCQEYKTQNKETYIIFDEIASLDISGNTLLGKAILQGRKIKLNIISATQILCGEGVKEKTSILCGSSLHIAFSVDKKMRGEIAKEIDKKRAADYEEQLKSLGRGEALVYGELEGFNGRIEQDRCIKVKITND